MAGAHSNPLWSRHLFKAVLMVLGALLLVHSASAQTHREFASPGQQKRESSADILTEIGRSLKETLDTWLGPETMHVISETLLQVMWAISSAISVACFALSGIAAQLLSALGLDGEQLTQALKLSPSQVQTLLLWGAAALVIYWLLSLLLGLVLALLGRILGGLKLVLFVAGFVGLVRSVPDPSTRALLLLALLTVFALLSRLTGSRSSGTHEGAGQPRREGRAAEGGAKVAEGRGRGRPGGRGEGRKGERRLPPGVSSARRLRGGRVRRGVLGLELRRLPWACSE